MVVVTMALDAADGRAEALGAVLARYVVVARGHEGCTNVDLCVSVTRPGRFVVLQKWATAEAQRAHLDSPDMVSMAAACRDLLASPPDLDLLDAVSAHDLA